MRKSFAFSSQAASLAALLLAGCASNTPAPLVNYQPENFGASNAYVHHYTASPARTCEAARRALLSQGYVMDADKAGQVAGRKYFQPDQDHHVQLEFRVVCTAQGQAAGGGTTVFASGLQDQYSLRKTKESASLGVGVLGSLSVPLQGGTDEMVKVSSATIMDANLYQRLFDLIDSFLRDGLVPQNIAPPPTAPVPKAVPMPVQVQVQLQEPTPVPAPALAPASVSAPAAASVPAAASAPAAAAELTPATAVMPASAASFAASAVTP